MSALTVSLSPMRTPRVPKVQFINQEIFSKANGDGSARGGMLLAERVARQRRPEDMRGHHANLKLNTVLGSLFTRDCSSFTGVTGGRLPPQPAHDYRCEGGRTHLKEREGAASSHCSCRRRFPPLCRECMGTYTTPFSPLNAALAAAQPSTPPLMVAGGHHCHHPRLPPLGRRRWHLLLRAG